jgi:hypothetical protein
MNGQKLLSQFISLAIKRIGYENRDNALFTLKEIKEIIKFFIDIKKPFVLENPTLKTPQSDDNL